MRSTFKPYFGYEVPKGLDSFWGIKASAIYGMAVKPEYTAGGESGLGLEFDLEAYLLQTNRFRASAAYGILFPMGGLNLRANNQIAKQAETAQTFPVKHGYHVLRTREFRKSGLQQSTDFERFPRVLHLHQ